jgi:hypothetical protein
MTAQATVRRYAEGTSVSVEKSRMEIEALLVKHGASGFVSGWSEGVGFLQFRLHERMLRYRVDVPTADAFKRVGVKRYYADNAAGKCQTLADAEHRRRWRSLLLILKAKLELVASGDAQFDREFMADIMLPQGGTVGDEMVPQIAEAYRTGVAPKLLTA